MPEDQHDYSRIICTHCGEYRDVPVYCGRRFCPICSVSRNARTRSRVSYILNAARRRPGFQLKMITLTIPNQDNIWSGARLLVKCFRRLRAKRAWKSRVHGGLFVIEVTGRPLHYHVHLHVLVDCQFFPVRLLSKCWASVSPGKIVHVQRLPAAAAVSYVTKYLTKPSVETVSLTDVEFGLKGLRLFQPFGSWHGISRDWKQASFQCPNCGHCAWEVEQFFVAYALRKCNAISQVPT